MQVDDVSASSSTHSHARATAESLLRRYSADSAYGSASFGTADDESDPVSSLCFLVELCDRLDDDGNHAESIRCAESALVVRHVHQITAEEVQDWLQAHPEEVSASVKQTLEVWLANPVAQAKALVLRCNTLAVHAFNARQFDVASYYLTKALYLTSKSGEPILTVLSHSGSPTAPPPKAATADAGEAGLLSVTEVAALGSICFDGDDEERRRLQAATCNNAGCMERRRGRLDVSLLYLREAAGIEVQLDATGQSSASTYLNLCTVLNELQRYAEAVVTAERACNALQLAILEQSEEEEVAKVAMMLAVGQYNLGVSLERRGQPGDQGAAERAYQQCLATSQQYLVDQVCPSVEAAVEAIRRMKDPRRASVVARRSARGAMDDATPSDQKEHSVASKTQRESGAAAVGGDRSRTGPHAADTAVPHAASSSSHDSSLVAPFSWLPSQPSTAQTKHTASAAPSLPQLPLHGAAGPSVHAQAALTAQAVRDLTVSAPAARASRSGTSANSTNPPVLAATQNTLFRPAPPLGPASTRAERAGLPGLPPARPPVLAPLLPATATLNGVRSGPSLDLNPHAFAQTMPAASPFRAASATSSSRPRVGGGGGVALPQRGPRLSGSAAQAPPPRLSAATVRGPSAGQAPVATASSRNPLGRRTFGSVAAAEPGVGASLGRPSLGRPAPPAAQAGAKSRSARDPATAQAKRLEERLKRETRRRKDKEVAEHDAGVAEALHQQMVQGIKREELRRCTAAVVVIQAVWRGALARSFISAMMAATCVLQRAVRRFLVRRRETHRLEAAEQARHQAVRAQQERAAALVLQARTRQFLNRCRILREHRAARSRTYYAARTIQRGYRDHRTRLAEHVAAVAEAHYREDLQREFARRVAAKRIQRAYRASQSRKVELLAQQGRQRRHQAATAIQAVVRGVLTRSWFRYYKAYRRDQEVRSAANQRRLVLIQACCRATLAMHLIRQRRLDQLTVQRQRQLDTAATHIQCLWRCHVARIRFARLQAERARLDRRATFIQRWYRMCHERRAFVQYLDGVRRLRAALRIQRWLRDQQQRVKEQEFAAYHAEQLRLRRLQQQRQNAARLLQACLIARDSEVMVAGMQRDFVQREWCARLWQRVGRGCAARSDVALTMAVSRVVAEKDRVRARQTAAVLVLQRAWRCAAAKDTVEQKRRERAAARVIANSYKVHLAKKTLRALRTARDSQQRERAARTIQHAVRTSQQHRREVEMNEYYRGTHRKKMHTLRRQEAATMIQAVWRGHVTRQAVAEERAIRQALGFFATRIQRAWRARGQRRALTRELQVRAVERQYFEREAVVIQCFWRKMRAAEAVATRREAQQQRAKAALTLQCWWRQVLARRAALRQYLLRRDEDELALFYAVKWERACTVIHSFLRARAAALHVREERRLGLIGQLHYEGRARFMLRGDAATKIQATYRGHYERVYVRGLRREKAEVDRRLAEEATRQRRAAVCIQCAWRGYCARRERQALHDAKVRAILESQEDYLATAQPEEIVRELFWAESAVSKRQFTQERLQRQQARQDAATKIQKSFRSLTSTRAVKDVLEYKQRDKAARTIQAHWRAFKVRATVRHTRLCAQAVLVIQRYVRGWLVRKEWGPWRQAMELERRQTVRNSDRRDRAATVVQAAWRRTRAQRYTAYLRESLQMQKDDTAQEEAAALIQEAYRQHLRTRMAQTI